MLNENSQKIHIFVRKIAIRKNVIRGRNHVELDELYQGN